ncbi:MAG: tetratricopeptide repeat protein [Candidatus Sericytochromatia bacterium]|nr:tetratricopeptide repeat protein [Candidatus Sericytochromatia bacterium]
MTRHAAQLSSTLLLLAILPLSGMSVPLSPLAEGRLAYRIGRYEAAEALFRSAAEDPRRSAEAHLWLGRVAWRQGEAEEALGFWQQAAEAPETSQEAEVEMTDARQLLLNLTGLLDRYGAMRIAGPGGPGAGVEDWRALARDFDLLAEHARDTLVGRRASLMAGDAYAHAGETAEAIKRLQTGRARHRLLGDWALWRLAALEGEQAESHLRTLLDQHPRSPLRWEARVKLAELAPDPAQARDMLRAVVAEAGQRPAAERALFLLTQQPGASTQELMRYWDAYPEGLYLDEVVRALSARSGLSADTLYRIGSHHFFRSDYRQAARYFERVRSPMALYRLGRSLWGLDQLDRAIATLHRVVGGDRSLTGKAWLTIGQIEGQRGRWGAAVAAYHRAAASGGEAGVTAREKLSKALREQGRIDAARAMERSILQHYPWSEEATNITWSEFLAAIRNKRFQDALVNGKRLARHNPHHVYGVAAQYWIGRIYEKMGRRDEALGVYRGLIGRSPSSYYGWRATFRERVLTGTGADPWFSTRPGRAVQDLPVRYTDLLGPRERALAGGVAGSPLPTEIRDWPEAVRELLFLRQFDVADVHVRGTRSSNVKAWLSFLQQRYARAIAEEKGEPRLSYPLGFPSLLLNAAGRHGLDPLLLAALVREESRFDPQARSWVGATGLAQLMPFTAEWVYKQVPDVIGRPLTDPHCNLQLGAWYLAFTHRNFDGSGHYAVAAYNGGPGAVARWRRGFSGDPDEFVESIPYLETRLYVKKVFASFWNYCKLYAP